MAEAVSANPIVAGLGGRDKHSKSDGARRHAVVVWDSLHDRTHDG
jgi:hypothetical protein